VSSAALFKRKLDCRFYSILDMCFCSFVILWFFVFVISLSAFNVSTVCILPIPTSRSPWAHICVCFPDLCVLLLCVWSHVFYLILFWFFDVSALQTEEEQWQTPRSKLSVSKTNWGVELTGGIANRVVAVGPSCSQSAVGLATDVVD